MDQTSQLGTVAEKRHKYRAGLAVLDAAAGSKR